ncbi:MAG: hypothetical protein DMG87_03295 [Acidobacteria bacterium]|nr:MAG: hypothetical protein DMG87_03295 [Acidobacteriota bacterium]
MIVGVNKVENYEIAIYGSLADFAQQFGFPDAAGLLHLTLEEEKAADAKLTKLAETAINPRAEQERRAA